MKFYRYAPCSDLLQHYELALWRNWIISSVAWFSPIKLDKPTIATDPTHCAHDMLSIRPIQVEVCLYLGQTWSRKPRCRIGLSQAQLPITTIATLLIAESETTTKVTSLHHVASPVARRPSPKPKMQTTQYSPLGLSAQNFETSTYFRPIEVF